MCKPRVEGAFLLLTWTATPTSARLRAGASLTPSPVMPTCFSVVGGKGISGFDGHSVDVLVVPAPHLITVLAEALDDEVLVLGEDLTDRSTQVRAIIPNRTITSALS